MPSAISPAISALWDLDLAFADVVATSSDPRLGAIRLAWWREQLEDLDRGASPAEPRLQAVRLLVLPRGVTGAELSQLEDAWLPMLEPFPWSPEQAQGFRQRGHLLFRISARLLGAVPACVEGTGELWSLSDGAAHCSDIKSARLLRDAAEFARDVLPDYIPLKARPLTMLAALAASDLLSRGRLKRGSAALKHRLTGRFPA